VAGAVVGVPLQIIGGVIVAGASVYENWDKISAGSTKAATRSARPRTRPPTGRRQVHSLTGW